jgi:hypothetical protein
MALFCIRNFHANRQQQMIVIQIKLLRTVEFTRNLASQSNPCHNSLWQQG